MKTKKKPFWKIFSKNIQLINNGGWHFSFLKDPESIRDKIFSYSHQEYNTDKFTDLGQIEQRITKGEDLFCRDIIYKRYFAVPFVDKKMRIKFLEDVKRTAAKK